MEWMKEWCLMDMTHLYLGKYKALKVAYHPYININFHPSIHPSINDCMLTILTNCTCIYLYIHCHSFSYCKYIPEYAMHAIISFFRFCIKFFNIWYICIFTYTQIVNIMEKIYAIHTCIHMFMYWSSLTNYTSM